MALQATDNRFDWCNRLLKARQNYSVEECCNIIKSELSKLKGADPDYVAAIISRAPKDFPVSKLYFPVYETTITATYTWDTVQKNYNTDKFSDVEIRTTTTTTTTNTERDTFNKTFHRGVYDALDVTAYAGRTDQRFYQLNHVDDLDGSIYNDNCIYRKSDMEIAVNNAAMDHKKRKQVFVNQWSCTACMIPIVIITVAYQGHSHKWYFNAHNGKLYSEGYLVSKRVESSVKEAVTKTRIPHIITGILSALAVIITFATADWSSNWFTTLLSFALSIIGGIVLINKAFIKQNATHIRNQFGKDGPDVEHVYKKSIILMIVSICICVWCSLSAIIW